MARTRIPQQDLESTSAQGNTPQTFAPAVDNGFMASFLNPTPNSVFGTGGANGRQALIGAQTSRAYNAGFNAPWTSYGAPGAGGDVYRTVPSDRWAGYAEHRWSDISGGRYNDPGSRLIYTSPSSAESGAEMHAYPRSDGKPALADQTMVRMNYDAQGRMADVTSHLPEAGIQRSALTGQKGKLGLDRLHRLTGEEPYQFTRAIGQGATDAGASSMRVPSATGGNQIDIIPTNTDARQIQYKDHVHFDTDGVAGRAVVDPLHVNQHTNGMHTGVMPHGDGFAPAKHPMHANPDYATTSKGATSRAGNLRYAAAGAGGMSALSNIAAVANGEKGVGDAMLSVAGDTGVGVLSGAAQDALTARMGGTPRAGFKAGAIVDAVTSGAFSTWDNADAYKRGDVNASQATANVLVDTGIGVGSGLAGAAAGAAIGSVIPVAGTAVGALIGFGAGMAGSYLANKLAYGSGFADWAKEGLGGVLGPANEYLTGAWDGISAGKDWVSNKAGEAWDGAKNLGSNAWEGAKNLGSNAWEGAKGLGNSAWEGAKSVGTGIANTASNAWEGAKNVGSSAWEGAKSVGSGIADTASNAWDGAKNLGGKAWDAVTSW